MFTSGGQPDLWCVVARGGGKGGGGGGAAPQVLPPIVLTDPVNGKTFVQQPGGTLNANTGQIDYTSAQDQLNAEIAERQAAEKAKSDELAGQKTTDTAAQRTKFEGARQAAYDSALQNTIRQFQLQGADPNAYMESDILPALKRQFSSVQDLDPNPSAAFPTNLGDTIINSVTGGKRTQASNALNSIFTPTYSQNMLPDSITGNYTSDIVNQQFNPLMEQLTNAQKRGTLGGAGYQAALDALNTKKAAATNQVNTLGQGILSTDRKSLDDYISGARTSANSLSLGSTFDPSTYAGTATGKVQDFQKQFGGALQNAVGGTKFADITELINAGGAVQGAQNPNAANPTGKPTTATGGGALSDMYVDPDVESTKGRGLGNTGSF